MPVTDNLSGYISKTIMSHRESDDVTSDQRGYCMLGEFLVSSFDPLNFLSLGFGIVASAASIVTITF